VSEDDLDEAWCGGGDSITRPTCVERTPRAPVVFARASGLISAGDASISGCWFDAFAATGWRGYGLWSLTFYILSYPDDMTDPTSTTPDAFH
jgi:hypothetical protein